MYFSVNVIPLLLWVVKFTRRDCSKVYDGDVSGT